MKRRPSPGGFTLLEVLVALTILSISLAVLMTVFSRVLDITGDNRSQAQARVLAQSLLADASAHPPLGDIQGRKGELSWRLHGEVFEPRNDISFGLQAAALSATVTWGNGTKPQSLTLETLALLPRRAAAP